MAQICGGDNDRGNLNCTAKAQKIERTQQLASHNLLRSRGLGGGPTFRGGYILVNEVSAWRRFTTDFGALSINPVNCITIFTQQAKIDFYSRLCIASNEEKDRFWLCMWPQTRRPATVERVKNGFFSDVAGLWPQLVGRGAAHTLTHIIRDNKRPWTCRASHRHFYAPFGADWMSPGSILRQLEMCQLAAAPQMEFSQNHLTNIFFLILLRLLLVVHGQNGTVPFYGHIKYKHVCFCMCAVT